MSGGAGAPHPPRREAELRRGRMTRAHLWLLGWSEVDSPAGTVLFTFVLGFLLRLG